MDKYYIKRGLVACVVLGLMLYGLMKRDLDNEKLVQRVAELERTALVYSDALRQHAAVISAMQPILAYAYGEMQAKGLVDAPEPPPEEQLEAAGLEVPIVGGKGIEVPIREQAGPALVVSDRPDKRALELIAESKAEMDRVKAARKLQEWQERQ